MMAHSSSPDGRQILFESAVEGNSDLYIVSVEAGNAVRLTTSPAIESLATWSRDERSVFYTTVVSGMNAEIWRIPSQGGSAKQITNSGSEPQQSADEQYIYYLDRPPLGGRSGRVMRMPSAGGSAKVVLDSVIPFYWSVAATGIYFLRVEGQVHSIHVYRFADESIQRVGARPFRVAYFPQGPGRLTASRDGRWALVSVTDRWENDLMLLDNFR
jgi:hypothetical protein